MVNRKRTPRHAPEYYLASVKGFIQAKGPQKSGDIAKLLGLSAGGAGAMLAKLVERGELTRDADGRGTHPLYDLPIPSGTLYITSPAGQKPLTRQKSATKQVSKSFDQDRRIAEAATILFGDVKSQDLLSLLQWVQLTKELM